MIPKRPIIDINLIQNSHANPFPQGKITPKTTQTKSNRGIGNFNQMDDYNKMYLKQYKQYNKLSIKKTPSEQQINQITPKITKGNKITGSTPDSQQNQQMLKYFPKKQALEIPQKIKNIQNDNYISEDQQDDRNMLNSKKLVGNLQLKQSNDRPLSNEQKSWRQNYLKNLKNYQNQKQVDKPIEISESKVLESVKSDKQSQSVTSLQKFITQVNRGDNLSNLNLDSIQQNIEMNPMSQTQKNQILRFPKTKKPQTPLVQQLQGENDIKHDRSNSGYKNRNEIKEEKILTTQSTSQTTKNSNNNENTKIFHFPTHTKAASFSVTKTIQSPQEKEQNISQEDKITFKNNSAVINKIKTNFQNNNSQPPKNQIQNQQIKIQINKSKQPTYYLSDLEKAFKQPLSNDYFSQIYREHFVQTCQGILYSNLAKPSDPKDLQYKKVVLKKRDSNFSKTIIFDLDETLIHCNENINIPHDVKLQIKFPTGEMIEAGINIRPFAREILQELSKDFEIIIFTASHSCYAKAVLDYLDPQNQYIHHKFYRDHCIQTLQGVYIKDLRIFSDRNMEDMVLIDNAAYSFSFQIDNGIPIIPFYHNKEDKELKELLNYIKKFKNCEDTREINKQYLKLRLFNDVEGPQKVFQKLFSQKN